SIIKNSFNLKNLPLNFAKKLAFFLIICQFSLLFVVFSHQLTSHLHQNDIEANSDFDSKKTSKDQHHCFICFLNQFSKFLILSDILFLNLALIFIKYLFGNFSKIILLTSFSINSPRAPPLFV
ncbi:MAG: hypothetical protein ACKO6C_00405, partial [Alphaproteobacteria bacterium]